MAPPAGSSTGSESSVFSTEPFTFGLAPPI